MAHELHLLYIMGTGWLIVGIALTVRLVFAVAVAIWTKRHHWCRPDGAGVEQLPGVSILKPVCGSDENWEANLESFARLDYPRLEIICGAALANDPALAVAKRVAARYPEGRIVVRTCTFESALNPKVQNLVGLLGRAQYDLCLISDSNVAAEPGDLRRLVAPFVDQRVGLVYQPVVGQGEGSCASALENSKLTDGCGFFMIALKALAIDDIVMGKGMLLRRAALDSIGGLQAVYDIAAEDYVLGVELRRAGWRLELANTPARAVHRRWSLEQFVQRALRHAALRVRLCPWAYPLELMANPPACGALAFLWSGMAAWPAFVVAIVLKLILEIVVARRLSGRWPCWRYVPLWPVKDLLMAGLWLPAIFCSTVNWRGNTLHLGWRTHLSVR